MLTPGTMIAVKKTNITLSCGRESRSYGIINFFAVASLSTGGTGDGVRVGMEGGDGGRKKSAVINDVPDPSCELDEGAAADVGREEVFVMRARCLRVTSRSGATINRVFDPRLRLVDFFLACWFSSRSCHRSEPKEICTWTHEERNLFFIRVRVGIASHKTAVSNPFSARV